MQQPRSIVFHFSEKVQPKVQLRAEIKAHSNKDTLPTDEDIDESQVRTGQKSGPGPHDDGTWVQVSFMTSWSIGQYNAREFLDQLVDISIRYEEKGKNPWKINHF
jgi:hypothetical protein